MLLLTLLLSLYLALARCEDASQSRPRDTDLLDSYDFVIVGGGTSGLTVADRLTENPNGELARKFIDDYQLTVRTSHSLGHRARPTRPS